MSFDLTIVNGAFSVQSTSYNHNIEVGYIANLFDTLHINTVQHVTRKHFPEGSILTHVAVQQLDHVSNENKI